MVDATIHVLIIEDNPGDAKLTQLMLAEAHAGKSYSTSLSVFHASRLAEGVARVAEGDIQIVLLDLSLPDSVGLDTFERLHFEAPEMPIVVMTSLDDELMALRAVRGGAQDYLVKGQVDSNLLVRSLRHAIERQQMKMALQSLSMIDELTGLYNRRGFLNLSLQHVKLADRTGRELLLLYADLDDFKAINDTFGHGEGDAALRNSADLLKQTFRDSDIVGRIGGDEFAALAVDCSQPYGESAIRARLNSNLATLNAEGNRGYRLSMSVGTARYDPTNPCSLDELLTRADREMYEQKRNRQEEVSRVR